MVTMLNKVANWNLALAALVTVGAVGCNVDEPLDRPTPTTPAEEQAIEEVRQDLQQPAGYDLAVEFEARFNAVTGNLDFRVLRSETFIEQPADGDLRTLGAAQWCVQRVVADGTIGTNPLNSMEIYSEPGSNFLDGACAPPGDTDTEFEYTLSGAFCTDVTVRSFYQTQLNNVHTEIYLMTPNTGYAGMRWPDGTGAPLLPGLSNTFGLWSYSDLGPADGRVGPPYGTPPDERTVKWVFDRAGDAPWYFRGRILAQFAEVCTVSGTPVDEDCDGRIDEGAGCYADGEPCNTGADCETGICASGRCGASSFELQGVVGTGGGGTMEGQNRRMMIRIGAPQPMGEAAGGSYGIRLGPLSDR